MSEVQHQQQHQQWQEYFDLIQRASQSRSDAVQIIGEINKLTKEKSDEKINLNSSIGQ